MNTNRITWYPARTPQSSGVLAHKFTVNGPHAQTVWNWLAADNAHGEWLLPNAPVGESFSFHIHEESQDAESARCTRGHITHLKLSGANVPEMEWHEHGPM